MGSFKIFTMTRRHSHAYTAHTHTLHALLIQIHNVEKMAEGTPTENNFNPLACVASTLCIDNAQHSAAGSDTVEGERSRHFNTIYWHDNGESRTIHCVYSSKFTSLGLCMVDSSHTHRAPTNILCPISTFFRP